MVTQPVRTAGRVAMNDALSLLAHLLVQPVMVGAVLAAAPVAQPARTSSLPAAQHWALFNDAAVIDESQVEDRR